MTYKECINKMMFCRMLYSRAKNMTGCKVCYGAPKIKD